MPLCASNVRGLGHTNVTQRHCSTAASSVTTSSDVVRCMWVPISGVILAARKSSCRWFNSAPGHVKSPILKGLSRSCALGVFPRQPSNVRWCALAARRLAAPRGVARPVSRRPRAGRTRPLWSSVAVRPRSCVRSALDLHRNLPSPSSSIQSERHHGIDPTGPSARKEAGGGGDTGQE